jgi:hypothetical protein
MAIIPGNELKNFETSDVVEGALDSLAMSGAP